MLLGLTEVGGKGGSELSIAFSRTKLMNETPSQRLIYPSIHPADTLFPKQ
jgi:hypothetical protein